MKLWEKYFLKEIASIFFLLLGSFYFLFILIDYTSRASSLFKGQVGMQELVFYYLLLFVKRIDLLVPFALLIATLKALISLNTNRELVALLASGIPLKRLLRPFLFSGIACAALLYVNFQVLSPLAWIQIQKIEDRYMAEEDLQNRQGIQQVLLDDGSVVFCQSYDSARKLFFDSYWIRSIDEVWRIKYLYPDPKATLGRFVDQIKRNEKGEMKLLNSWETKLLNDLSFNKEQLQATLILPEEMSLTDLWKKMPLSKKDHNTKEAAITARFYNRLAMPLLCILAVIGPAPFCVIFSRQVPTLLITIFSIVGLITFYLLSDATFVLAKGQVFSPFLIIFAPYMLYAWIFGRRYASLDSS